ncbi:hypothetical protein GB937_000116 [Aspergillus fischeri]|nr:hypothetical protein GB937_000116 [Aspergillus fischeri]
MACIPALGTLGDLILRVGRSTTMRLRMTRNRGGENPRAGKRFQRWVEEAAGASHKSDPRSFGPSV